MLRLGLDIGGTKIEGLLLDANGSTLAKRRIATPTHDYAAFLAAIKGLVADFADDAKAPFSIGICMPGAISPLTGRIKNSNCLILNGEDLRGDLTRMLEQPVYLANDADCFTLSEAVDGAAQGGKVVFGVILGTGCGGGLVVNQHLIVGPNAISGEWGHNPLPGYQPDTDGPAQPCYCGRQNCIERFISGTGLTSRFNQQQNLSMTAPEILAAAESGEPIARQHYQHFIDALARSVGSIINMIDPDVIVFGGGLSNVTRIYADLAEKLPSCLFSDGCLTRLVQARHGDSSGVRGAAWLPAMQEG